MNQNKTQKILIGIAIVIIAVIGWYFLYFTKTPAYSLNLAKEAYTSHNLQQFKKHVDVDSIIGSALDDAFEVQMEKEKNNPFAALGKGLFESFKPAIVKQLSAEVYKIVATEETGAGDKKSDGTSEALQEASGVKGLEFKTIGSSDIDGDVAIVPLVFTDPQKDGKEVIIKLEMQRLEDKTWKVTRIVNLKEVANFEKLLN